MYSSSTCSNKSTKVRLWGNCFAAHGRNVFNLTPVLCHHRHSLGSGMSNDPKFRSEAVQRPHSGNKGGARINCHCLSQRFHIHYLSLSLSLPLSIASCQDHLGKANRWSSYIHKPTWAAPAISALPISVAQPWCTAATYLKSPAWTSKASVSIFSIKPASPPLLPC